METEAGNKGQFKGKRVLFTFVYQFFVMCWWYIITIYYLP